MNAHTTTSKSPRSFARAAAITLGALGLAGAALVGIGPSASAAPAGAGATNVADAARPAQAVRAICLAIESARGDDDSDCGRRVEVQVRGAIQSVRLGARGETVCVAVLGIRGDRDQDCARGGGWAEAGVRGIVQSVWLFVDDTRLCGEAHTARREGDRECSGRRGWLELESPGRGGISGLDVWISDRRGRS